jgi:hypothetical protein
MGILWLKLLAAWLNIFVAAYSLQGFVAAYGGLRRRLRGIHTELQGQQKSVNSTQAGNW